MESICYVGFMNAEGAVRRNVGPEPIRDHRQRRAAARSPGENADAVRVSLMETAI